MSRFQQGSLRKKGRGKGAVWILRYYATRDHDGKRVERTLTIGNTKKYPSESSAWAEAERRRAHERINEPGFAGAVTLGQLAAHYIEHELADQSLAIEPRSHTTVASYKRVLRLRVLPRWEKRVATSIKPLEVEQWLKALKSKDGLANPTLAKTRNVMSLVYRHGIRHSLITGGEASNPMQHVRCRTTSDYESMTIEPSEAFAIWQLLPEPERLLLLLCACTGVRVSEGLACSGAMLITAATAFTSDEPGLAVRLALRKQRHHAAVCPCTEFWRSISGCGSRKLHRAGWPIGSSPASN